MIVAAAIKLTDDDLYVGNLEDRHCDVISRIRKEGIKLPILQDNQGFVTDEGQFLRRGAAGAHAMKSGQITKLKFPPNLYSEDLW